MRMKITQYAYPGDKNSDSETRAGHGKWHDLVKGVSCAVTDSAREALGAHGESWVKITFASGKSQVRRIDDRAPEAEKRCDLYNPDGFDQTLDDYGDVALTSAPALPLHP